MSFPGCVSSGRFFQSENSNILSQKALSQAGMTHACRPYGVCHLAWLLVLLQLFQPFLLFLLLLSEVAPYAMLVRERNGYRGKYASGSSAIPSRTRSSVGGGSPAAASAEATGWVFSRVFVCRYLASRIDSGGIVGVYPSARPLEGRKLDGMGQAMDSQQAGH